MKAWGAIRVMVSKRTLSQENVADHRITSHRPQSEGHQCWMERVYIRFWILLWSPHYRECGTCPSWSVAFQLTAVKGDAWKSSFMFLSCKVKIKAVLKCPLQGWEKLAREESLAIWWLCAVRLFSWTRHFFLTVFFVCWYTVWHKPQWWYVAWRHICIYNSLCGLSC